MGLISGVFLGRQPASSPMERVGRERGVFSNFEFSRPFSTRGLVDWCQVMLSGKSVLIGGNHVDASTTCSHHQSRHLLMGLPPLPKSVTTSYNILVRTAKLNVDKSVTLARMFAAIP